MSFDPKNVPLRNSASRKAMDQFAVPNRPSAAIQRELRLEREAVDAKTAKLRALRLARDEKALEAAALAAANGPPPKLKKLRKTIITG
jgi:hypothetical protein